MFSLSSDSDNFWADEKKSIDQRMNDIGIENDQVQEISEQPFEQCLNERLVDSDSIFNNDFEVKLRPQIQMFKNNIVDPVSHSRSVMDVYSIGAIKTIKQLR